MLTARPHLARARGQRPLGALARLDGCRGDLVAMAAEVKGQRERAADVVKALDLHPCSVLSFARSWRADDLGPKVAPDLMPEIVRRVVRGERGRGPLRTLAEEWTARKCRDGGLRAAPRLLCTYADPGVGHDGALYRAAGAAACGPGVGGKLLFAWALDPALKDPLRRLAAAVEERGSAP